MSTSATTTAAPTRTPLATLSSCCAPPATASPEAAQELATMFKALADPARVTIMSMLLNAEEVCACDLAAAIGKSQATASHHLGLLRSAGLVESERRGTWAYYRAVPERLAGLRDALTLLR